MKENEAKEKDNSKQKKKNQQTTANKSTKNITGDRESSLSANHNDPNPKSPDLNSIEAGSVDYLNGYNSAMSNYKGGLNYFQIPCYVSTVSEDHDPTMPPPYK